MSEERPLREIFSKIYSEKVWGDDGSRFSSGGGSAENYIVRPYIEKIRKELKTYGDCKPRIVDLGCGNFNIGRNFVDCCSRYTAVDIVPELIESLRSDGYPDHVRFLALDITTDELPEGDVCFLRQVLQHLSNDQIMKVLPKLEKYRVLYITEQQPMPDHEFTANQDKAAGPGTRLHENSGVYLDRSPFNFILPGRLILSVPGGPDGLSCDGLIQTYRFSWPFAVPRHFVRGAVSKFLPSKAMPRKCR